MDESQHGEPEVARATMTPLREQLDGWQSRLDELARKHNVPGAVLAVAKDGEAAEFATGLANVATGLPTTTDTLFHQASITKVFTASMVMQLFEEGRIQLDEPVRKYLPSLRFADDEANEKVTPRHLLSHTSGFDGSEIGDFGCDDEAPERYLESVAELPQISPPGAIYSYCNGGYIILGQLIAALDERPWAESLRARLLDPLGIATPVTRPEEVLFHRAAVGHNPSDGGATVNEEWARRAGVASGGAHMYVKAADLLSFLNLFLNQGRTVDGKELLSPASVQAMQNVQADIPDKSREHMCGLGLMMADWDGRRVFGHDGNNVGFSSFCRFLPEERLSLVLLTNYLTGHTMFDDLAKEFFGDVLGIHVPDPPRPATGPVDIDLDLYEGMFVRHQLRVKVSRQEDGLVAFPSGPLSAGLPESVPLKPGTDRSTFFVALPNLPVLIPVVFANFDADGRPTYLTVAGRNSRRTT